MLAGAVVGWLAERGGDRTTVRTVGTMFVGTLLVYAVGMPYLAGSLHVGLGEAFRLGVRPFLLGDTLKVLVAAGCSQAHGRWCDGFGRKAARSGTDLMQRHGYER